MREGTVSTLSSELRTESRSSAAMSRFAGKTVHFIGIAGCGMAGLARMLLDAGAKVTVTEHGEPFAAAVELGVVSATQFHPEKSADAGAAVLANWLATL